jgi:very-short-patch-repair endonuclease
VLELAATPPELSTSSLEDAFLALLDRHGLPRPRVNVPMLGYTLDFLWPQARLIVETDGRGAHATRRWL